MMSGWRLAAFYSTLIASVATWPIILDPSGGLLGHPGNDVWNHVWGYWWVAHELGQGHLPLSTNLMHFPQVSRLFFIDTFGAVLTLPIQWLAGPVVAYNSAFFLSFWTASFCAWALCRQLLNTHYAAGPTNDRAALLGATAYALAPHLLAQAYNGITETLNAAGLPLTMLALVRLYERPDRRRSLEGALAFGVSMLANWYYGLFGAIGAALYLLLMAVWRRERIHWRALPLALGGVGLGSIFIFGPALAGFSSTLEGEGAMVSRDREFVWKQLITHNVTDPLTFFHPGKFYSPDLKALHGEDLLIVVYLGWVLMGLAALGLWRLKRWRDGAPWLFWALFFAIMALGPYLYLDGQHVLLEGRRIPLPFLAFFNALPMFERISHPFRFVMGVSMGLGVLGSFGYQILPNWGRALALGLLSTEFLLASPAVWPLPRASAAIPRIYETVLADDTPGGLLDLPVMIPNLERAVYLYWQTEHQRPGPYALNEPLPEVLGRSHLIRAILAAEGSRMDHLPPMLGELDLVVAGRSLGRLGFRYIVVHGDLYPPIKREQVLSILRMALGPETQHENNDWLWQLQNVSVQEGQ